MKKIINCLIFLYLLPLRISNRLSLYIKGKILLYEEHYVIAIDVIRRYFPNDRGVIIDIGAYDGDSATFFGKRLPNNLIIGFEPNRDLYKAGVERVKNYPNIQLHNVGLADFSGEADLHITKNIASSSLLPINEKAEHVEVVQDRIIKVAVDTLDSFFKECQDVLLIKLDVQGAELKVLKGGTETLKRTKLVLTEVSVVEMYQGGCLYFELDAFLRGNGFLMHTSISNYNHEGTKYHDILYLNSKFRNS